MMPKEIWLVDFKTDELDGDDLSRKVRTYEPQLRLYGMALSRIYRRPVNELHLYFLAARRAVEVTRSG